MDIFLSYRRGPVDSSQARHVRDFLVDLGFDVYFDGDETANPTGGLFPDSIARALDASAILVAVIGRSWIDQIDRLQDEQDWVRTELLAASPGRQRQFVPIYLGCSPADLTARLPPPLAFVERTNSHLLWTQFGELEKEQLHRLLEPDLAQAAISAERLRSLCACRLSEDIQRVAGRKFLPELYQVRKAEAGLASYRDAPGIDLNDLATQLEVLQRIGERDPRVGLSRAQLQEIGARMRRSASAAQIGDDLARLKTAFRFTECERVLRELQVALTGERALYPQRIAAVLTALRQLHPLRPQEVAELREELDVLRDVCDTAQRAPAPRELRSVHRRLPSIDDDEEMRLANDAIKQLQLALQRLDRICLAIVDRAGRGKTNVLAHWVRVLSAAHPVLFLGAATIAARGRSIEEEIQTWFDHGGGRAGRFDRWLDRASKGLRRDDGWMYVAIDGINEPADTAAFGRELAGFLERIQGHRIRVLLTCRDIFWDSFVHGLGPFLFGGRTVELGDFSDEEQSSAIAAYLAGFEIRAELGPSALRTLRHPLLLRLFCETHAGQDLGALDALRGTKVLEKYVDGATRAVAERARLRSPQLVDEVLLRVASRAWDARQSAVAPAVLGLAPGDTARIESVYTGLLAQGVLRETASPGGDQDARVAFVYDEVFEYFLGRCWDEQLRQTGRSPAALTALIADVAQEFVAYPAVAGALLNLDQALELGGQLANRLLDRLQDLGDDVVCTRQFAILQLAESANVTTLGAPALALLLRFESLAATAIRKRLGDLVVRFQQEDPDREGVRALVARMLGVEAAPAKAGKGVLFRLTKRAQAPAALVLPPVRFQYATQTRLNAIALLVRGTDADREMADKAMSRLGMVDLSASLRAIEAIDGAADEVVVAMIPAYLEERAPEYRLYATWLLRQRHGPAPAALLVRLLLDPSARVREYTRRMLRTRRAEPELVSALCERLRSNAPLENWGRIQLIDALAMCMPHDDDRVDGREAVEPLLEHMASSSMAIRVQAARALVTWGRYVVAADLVRLQAIGNEVASRTLQRLGTRPAEPAAAAS